MVDTDISGNRLLLDGDGPNALARLDWDVLNRSGVRYLILFEVLSMISRVLRPMAQPYGKLLKSALNGVLRRIAAQAHPTWHPGIRGHADDGLQGFQVLLGPRVSECAQR